MLTFREEEEAFAMANASGFGLVSGTVWVNRYGRSNDFSLPAGGFKKSRIGKDLGRKAYEASLKPKTMLIEF